MLVILVVIDIGRSKCIYNTIMVITPPRPEIFLLQTKSVLYTYALQKI